MEPDTDPSYRAKSNVLEVKERESPNSKFAIKSISQLKTILVKSPKQTTDAWSNATDRKRSRLG